MYVGQWFIETIGSIINIRICNTDLQTCTILEQKMTHINYTYRTIWLLHASFSSHALSSTTPIFAAFLQVFAVRVMLTLNSTVTNSKNVLWAGHCE